MAGFRNGTRKDQGESLEHIFHARKLESDQNLMSQENETQATEWEKTLSKDTYNKGLLSNIYKILLNLNNKKIT